MLSCLFYICSSNFPIHIWNKAQQGKWKISHFWRADVKIPSFTFGEYVGSTLSIRGRPCYTQLNLQNWQSPNLKLCSPTKYVWVQISYLAQPTKLTKSQSHTMLNHQIWLSIESHTQLNLQNWQSLNLILCSPTKYDKVLISYFAQPHDHCPHTPFNCSSVTHFIPHHLPIAHTCSYLVAHQSSAFWVWNRCCPPGAHMFLNTSFSFGNILMGMSIEAWDIQVNLLSNPGKIKYVQFIHTYMNR